MDKIIMLGTGERAPSFKAEGTENFEYEKTTDHNLVLVFYPEDESSVCSNQLALYNEILPMFSEYDGKVIGISVDSVEDHKKFSKNLNLKFPLLSDQNPKGEIAKKYGVYDEKNNIAYRAMFVIDKNGIIQWSQKVPYNINPGAEGILEALEKITN